MGELAQGMAPERAPRESNDSSEPLCGVIVDHLAEECALRGFGDLFPHDFAIEEALEDIMGAAEEEGDEDDEGAGGEDASAEEAPTEVGAPGGIIEEEVAHAEEALVEPALPEGVEINEDGSIRMTKLGYVTCLRPPHNPDKTVGLVGLRNDGRSRFASCHLHPRCDLQVGIVREDVPRMRIAEWLALGIPSDGLPQAERLKMGAQHRARWTRTGPFKPPA